jgi:hypothetical protein
MVLSRESHKYERVTITLVPSADESNFRRVPSTFSSTNRTYTWRHFEHIDYMIVPRSVSNSEIKVDMFVDVMKGGRQQGKGVQKFVQDFVKTKIQTAWKGFKLGSISRPTSAAPPGETFKRGTIEEILGTNLDT